jgi:predicted  nucleic acid-binding Zn-ribbon protein
MVQCERCGSKFHSIRAALIENCPRCLLRDDVSARLVAKDPSPPPVAPGTATQASQG